MCEFFLHNVFLFHSMYSYFISCCLLAISHQKMASSPQEIILTSSPDTPITAYDASTGATLAHFAGSRSPRRGLALAGKTLIAASHISSDTAAASIHLYNWWSSVAFNNIPVPEPIAPLTATLDGSYLFSGGLSGYIHALTLPSGDLLRSFPAHSKPVSCLTLNDDGSLLISGGDDGTISVFPILRILDTTSTDHSSSGKQFALYSFCGHDSSVTSIHTSMGGSSSTIISCSLDCTCKFWTLSHGTHLRTVRFPCMIWGFTMDPTETDFYAGGSDGRVYAGVLKVNKRQLIRTAREVVAWEPAHNGAVTAVAMVNEGRNLVSASEDGSVRVWEVGTGTMLRVLGHERGSINDIVVAKGIRNGRGCGVRHGSGGGSGGSSEYGGGQSLGYSGRQIRRPVRELNEMEETLCGVVKDRRRAINTLETAIGTYERLLGLILKEAKEGGGEGADESTSTSTGNNDPNEGADQD